MIVAPQFRRSRRRRELLTLGIDCIGSFGQRWWGACRVALIFGDLGLTRPRAFLRVAPAAASFETAAMRTHQSTGKRDRVGSKEPLPSPTRIHPAVWHIRHRHKRLMRRPSF